jgi:hypothetical protein
VVAKAARDGSELGASFFRLIKLPNSFLDLCDNRTSPSQTAPSPTSSVGYVTTQHEHWHRPPLNDHHHQAKLDPEMIEAFMHRPFTVKDGTLGIDNRQFLVRLRGRVRAG